MTVIVPTVHLNGTSKNELMEQLANAIRACTAAEQAIALAAPNGRDYYLQGSHVIQAALNCHCERLARIASVRAELEAIAEYVVDQ